MSLRLALGCLDVTLSLDVAPEAEATLSRVWALAKTPPRTARVARVEYAVVRDGPGYRVRNLATGAPGPRLDDPRDVAPFVEAALYADLQHHAPHLGYALLHAALVGDAQEAYLFVGASGAGKSALARAAVEAGLDYHGDEHVLFDHGGAGTGAGTDAASAVDTDVFVGLPRAIHLDARPEAEPPPPWALDADHTTYRFTGRDGVPAVLPLVHVPRAASDPYVRAPCLVALRHADGEDDGLQAPVTPGSRAAMLAALEEATLCATPTGLASLARPRPFVTLVWRQPRTALEALRAAHRAADERARARAAP